MHFVLGPHIGFGAKELLIKKSDQQQKQLEVVEGQYSILYMAACTLP